MPLNWAAEANNVFWFAHFCTSPLYQVFCRKSFLNGTQKIISFRHNKTRRQVKLYPYLLLDLLDLPLGFDLILLRLIQKYQNNTDSEIELPSEQGLSMMPRLDKSYRNVSKFSGYSNRPYSLYYTLLSSRVKERYEEKTRRQVCLWTEASGLSSSFLQSSTDTYR